MTANCYLIEKQRLFCLNQTDFDLPLAPLQSAGCTYRIALGRPAGQRVLNLKTVPTQVAPSTVTVHDLLLAKQA